MADIITVYAPAHLDYYDSYGLIACELLRGLDALGVHVNAVALGQARHVNQPADVKRITHRPIRPSFGGIFLGYPTNYARHGGLSAVGRRVGVTMFESSKTPPGWTKALNELDAVIVPSMFCHDMFVNEDVTVPIHIAPLGISDVYKPAWREHEGRPYTFLAIGDRGKRKGGLDAVQAFVRAFGDDPDYRLLIKVRNVPGGAEILNENIKIIRQDMTPEELYQLYLSADCMVFPARGEGFGLPPREFAATGAPVIATDWGGTADGIEVWGIPLGYQLIKADWRGVKRFVGLDLGQWAEPDTDELARLMCQVAVNRVLYQSDAYEAAPAVREMYSWRRFAQTVYDVWSGIDLREIAYGYSDRLSAFA